MTTPVSELIANFITNCSARPPKQIIARLGREINSLIKQKIEPDIISSALDKLRTKGLNPSVLASLVFEAQQAKSRQFNANIGKAKYCYLYQAEFGNCAAMKYGAQKPICQICQKHYRGWQ